MTSYATTKARRSGGIWAFDDAAERHSVYDATSSDFIEAAAEFEDYSLCPSLSGFSIASAGPCIFESYAAIWNEPFIRGWRPVCPATKLLPDLSWGV